MTFKIHLSIILCLCLMSCSHGQLDVICTTEAELKEISAVEYDVKRNLFWAIQDSGNSNELLGINTNGKTVKRILLEGIKNKDWEDLTQDPFGNIYIGDFGNNNTERHTYKIYKIKASDLDKSVATAQVITFNLPKDHKEKDFEGFFIFKHQFYLFTKEAHKTTVYRVPNKKGEHKAKKLYSHKFHEKASKITSAAISSDGKTVVLLNHYRLWKLTDFKDDNFFSGKIEKLDFNHSSQKEGIGFLNTEEVIITDERRGFLGGYIYKFRLP